LVADGKALLAIDESNATCNQRFTAAGRQIRPRGSPHRSGADRYRHGLCESINGTILYNETISQKRKGVEPEVLMNGERFQDQCRTETGDVLDSVFAKLYTQRVKLEEMILKPNSPAGIDLFQPGKGGRGRGGHSEMFSALRASFRSGDRIPPGGQSGELASIRLNAMNLLARSPKFRLSWALTFSSARAIHYPALDIWHGRDSNVQAAQQALLRRATCNRAALRGEYSAAME
jgi:fructose-bisphosphate aldolase class I